MEILVSVGEFSKSRFPKIEKETVSNSFLPLRNHQDVGNRKVANPFGRQLWLR